MAETIGLVRKAIPLPAKAGSPLVLLFMDLNGLLVQVKEAIHTYADDQTRASGSFNATALIRRVEELFELHRRRSEEEEEKDALNRSEPHGLDPYGGLPDEEGQSADRGAGL